MCVLTKDIQQYTWKKVAVHVLSNAEADAKNKFCTSSNQASIALHSRCWLWSGFVNASNFASKSRRRRPQNRRIVYVINGVSEIKKRKSVFGRIWGTRWELVNSANKEITWSVNGCCNLQLTEISRKVWKSNQLWNFKMAHRRFKIQLKERTFQLQND